MSSLSESRPAAPSRFAMRFIEIYKAQVSPRLGRGCRFEPSCSEYAMQAYEEYGFLRATLKTLGRVTRCRKGSKGPREDPLR